MTKLRVNVGTMGEMLAIFPISCGGGAETPNLLHSQRRQLPQQPQRQLQKRTFDSVCGRTGGDLKRHHTPSTFLHAPTSSTTTTTTTITTYPSSPTPPDCSSSTTTNSSATTTTTATATTTTTSSSTTTTTVFTASPVNGQQHFVRTTTSTSTSTSSSALPQQQQLTCHPTLTPQLSQPPQPRPTSCSSLSQQPTLTPLTPQSLPQQPAPTPLSPSSSSTSSNNLILSSPRGIPTVSDAIPTYALTAPPPVISPPPPLPPPPQPPPPPPQPPTQAPATPTHGVDSDFDTTAAAAAAMVSANGGGDEGARELATEFESEIKRARMDVSSTAATPAEAAAAANQQGGNCSPSRRPTTPTGGEEGDLASPRTPMTEPSSPTSPMGTRGNKETYASRRRRFLRTAEVLRESGLLGITMKTAELLRRNQELQREIEQLQVETRRFVVSVLSNPENRPLLDAIHSRAQLFEVIVPGSRKIMGFPATSLDITGTSPAHSSACSSMTTTTTITTITTSSSTTTNTMSSMAHTTVTNNNSCSTSSFASNRDPKEHSEVDQVPSGMMNSKDVVMKLDEQAVGALPSLMPTDVTMEENIMNPSSLLVNSCNTSNKPSPSIVINNNNNNRAPATSNGVPNFLSQNT